MMTFLRPIVQMAKNGFLLGACLQDSMYLERSSQTLIPLHRHRTVPSISIASNLFGHTLHDEPRLQDRFMAMRGQDQIIQQSPDITTTTASNILIKGGNSIRITGPNEPLQVVDEAPLHPAGHIKPRRRIRPTIVMCITRIPNVAMITRAQSMRPKIT
jgi:hypothetical protein